MYTPVLEIRDPQIRDPDPHIFTGIRIRRSGIRIRVFLQGFRSGIRAKNSADLQHWLYVYKKRANGQNSHPILKQTTHFGNIVLVCKKALCHYWQLYRALQHQYLLTIGGWVQFLSISIKKKYPIMNNWK